jgi:hypothetical protein
MMKLAQLRIYRLVPGRAWFTVVTIFLFVLNLVVGTVDLAIGPYHWLGIINLLAAWSTIGMIRRGFYRPLTAKEKLETLDRIDEFLARVPATREVYELQEFQRFLRSTVEGEISDRERAANANEDCKGVDPVSH